MRIVAAFARRRSPSLCAGVFLVAVPARADRLPGHVVPSHYDLSFAVDLARARFDGVETIHVEIGQPTRTVVLHAIEIAFREVTITAGSATQKATVSLNEAQQTATLTVRRELAEGARGHPHHLTRHPQRQAPRLLPEHR